MKQLTEPQAEKIYCKVYNQMLIKFGHNKTTTTGELNKIGKELFGSKYLGTFAQDRLPAVIYKKPSKYAIINVDTIGMPGTHWVAIAGLSNSNERSSRGKAVNKIMVFDSFGRASKFLLPLLREKSVIDTDPDAEQKQIQSSCGQFSLAWLYFFEKYGAKNAELI